jgi:hypothetical protein
MLALVLRGRFTRFNHINSFCYAKDQFMNNLTLGIELLSIMIV